MEQVPGYENVKTSKSKWEEPSRLSFVLPKLFLLEGNLLIYFTIRSEKESLNDFR